MGPSLYPGLQVLHLAPLMQPVPPVQASQKALQEGEHTGGREHQPSCCVHDGRECVVCACPLALRPNKFWVPPLTSWGW